MSAVPYSKGVLTADIEKEHLLQAIEKACSEIEQARIAFDELEDSAAVDYAAYALLAAQSKYTYLLKLARKRNLRI